MARTPKEPAKAEPQAGKKAVAAKKTKARAVGRPSSYSRALAERICDALADGRSLKSICEDAGMPAYSAVRRWERDNQEFQALSTRAREIGCHKLADECLDIADDGRNDWMERHGEEDAGWVANGEHIQRSRLRIDTRMRLLGKWLPKVYGDKLDVTQEVKLTGSVSYKANIPSRG